ncbi:hypothetical protein PFI31113_02642 [Pandoraea fibrosis]|uniref:Uncharacterized protein n=1 Tax=Pandoraea fibrosis TaxID=1891094 RepID=A0A5E4VHF6_9BURK|nr:hypothetical protein PFI31113_02642 [Pandoraea fibrosis]
MKYPQRSASLPGAAFVMWAIRSTPAHFLIDSSNFAMKNAMANSPRLQRDPTCRFNTHNAAKTPPSPAVPGFRARPAKPASMG